MRLPTLNRNALRSQQACIEQYWQVDGQDDGTASQCMLCSAVQSMHRMQEYLLNLPVQEIRTWR